MGTLCYKISIKYSYGRLNIMIYELLNMYNVIGDHCCIYYLLSH